MAGSDSLIHRNTQWRIGWLAYVVGGNCPRAVGGDHLIIYFSKIISGDPFSSDRAVSPAFREAMEQRFGLDQSAPVQYFNYLGGIIQGDLGPSTSYDGRSVNDIIATYLPVSILLGTLALVIALCLGMACGLAAAARPRSWTDSSVMGLMLLGVSLPTFVIGPLLQWSVAVRWDLLPVARMDKPGALILPALTLALPFAARIAGLVRAGVLEVRSQPYLLAARARGLSPWRIWWLHALPGAMAPVLGFLGPAIASLFTGSLVVETIFQIPGIGVEFVQAAINRDLMLTLGTVIVFATMLLAANALTDTLHKLIDPRVADD